MHKNKKIVSLKIPEKAQAIISQYAHEKGADDDLVFPDLKGVKDFSDRDAVERKMKYRIAKLDKALKALGQEIGLTKKLTMHIARHTFATIAGDKIPIQTLSKLYRHSSVLTTIGYQKAFMHKDSDDALDKVLNF